jgi:hypothetical protein
MTILIIKKYYKDLKQHRNIVILIILVNQIRLVYGMVHLVILIYKILTNKIVINNRIIINFFIKGSYQLKLIKFSQLGEM